MDSMENELITQLNTEINDWLTRDNTVRLLREILHSDSDDDEAGQRTGRTNRRKVAEPVSVQLAVSTTCKRGLTT